MMSGGADAAYGFVGVDMKDYQREFIEFALNK